MSTLLRVLRACLFLVMALIALAALALLLGRAWVKRDGPPPPVQAALAALQATPTEPAGPNGAVWLHLAPLALPEGFDDAQARHWVNQDLQHLQAHRAEILQRFRGLSVDVFEQRMRDVARKLPSRQAFALRPIAQAGATQSSNAPLACNGSACLDAVRAQTSAYAAALAQATSPALQHMLTATHWRSLSAEAEPNAWVLQQPWSLLRWPSTQAAFDFAQGRAQPAVDALCRHALQLRRLGDDAHAALDALALSRETLQAGDLLMRMLREAPTAIAGPDCQAAFAPNAKAAQVCRFARHDWHRLKAMSDGAPRGWHALKSWPFQDDTLSEWDLALGFHAQCSPEGLSLSTHAAADVHDMEKHLKSSAVAPPWLSLVSEALRAMQAMNAGYTQQQLLDTDAQRHALANWLWLRQRGQAHAAAQRAAGQAASSIPRAQWQNWLDQRPAELRDTHRALVLANDDEAPALRVVLWRPKQTALRSRCPGAPGQDDGDSDGLNLSLLAWPKGQTCAAR